MRGLSGVLGFPAGMVLLAGTAFVSPPGFIGRGGDEVIMAPAGLGEIHDVVGVAGLPRPEEGGCDAGRTLARSG